jgi:Tfp pilus assembly protein PilF
MLKPVSFGLVLVFLVLLIGACAQQQPQTVYAPPPQQPMRNPVDDAIAFFNQGNYAEAKRILLNESRYNSMDPRTYVYMGRIYMYENECPSALAQFQKALVIDPINYEAKQQLQLAQQKCGAKQPSSSSGPKRTYEPAPRESNEFKGGAKAINPEKF